MGANHLSPINPMLFSARTGKNRTGAAQHGERQDNSDREAECLDLLQKSGMSVKSLRRGWRDDAKNQGELFFLVPGNPEEAHAGWFSREDLEEWMKGRGVIPKDALLEEMIGLNQLLEKAEQLLLRAGVELKGRPIPAWVVPESKVPGVRVLTKDQDLLPDGVYSLPHLGVMLSIDIDECVVTD